MGRRGAFAAHSRNTAPDRGRLGIIGNEAGHLELADFQFLFHIPCLLLFFSLMDKATEERRLAVRYTNRRQVVEK